MGNEAIINTTDLRLKGYKVEDMGAEYGSKFAGRYRWINTRQGKFQDDHSLSHSEHEAWQHADQHHRTSDKKETA